MKIIETFSAYLGFTKFEKADEYNTEFHMVFIDNKKGLRLHGNVGSIEDTGAVQSRQQIY